ncbi:DNA-processing protein DprA [Pseudodonghicola xiamenensis]|nr:DNA-processing protein DprA [Pseudodonghicola xiamenensis]
MPGTQHSSTHPASPSSEDDRINRLRLLRSRRVGISTYRRLMAEYGCAAEALRALPGIAREAGLEDYETCPEALVAAEMRAGHAARARLIGDDAPDYPAALHDLPDAPPLIWVVGDPALLARPAIALVGARNASSLGTRMARGLAKELGEAGFVIVSGLARGVDAAAHLASLQSGTIAVLAGGVDVIYPAENAGLAADIARQGLVLSEQPVGMTPQARHFPRRNRLISGLARAVVVIEAAARSGSLITARDALDQGRDVLAVPGHPFDARAAGCNMLIRDGATLVRNAEDVITALPLPQTPAEPDQPPQPPAPQQRSLRETAALHRQILDRLGPSPMAEDQLIRDLGTSPGRIGPALVDLELEGRIQRQAGGLLALLR